MEIRVEGIWREREEGRDGKGRELVAREIHNAVAGRLRHPLLAGHGAPPCLEEESGARRGRGCIDLRGQAEPRVSPRRTFRGANNSLASASTGHPLLRLFHPASDPLLPGRYFLLRFSLPAACFD